MTIEGLSENGELDPLQQAFLETGAVQCGFCTPGMIMAGKALLAATPDPSAAEVKAFLTKNKNLNDRHDRINGLFYNDGFTKNCTPKNESNRCIPRS